MKWIVAGGRDFTDKRQMQRALDCLLSNGDTIISGGAKGADTLGESYAQWRALDVIRMPADWEQHGKSAGAIRNQQMAQDGDALIAFWDGKSRGTKDMIAKATRRGVNVHIYRYTK